MCALWPKSCKLEICAGLHPISSIGLDRCRHKSCTRPATVHGSRQRALGNLVPAVNATWPVSAPKEQPPCEAFRSIEVVMRLVLARWRFLLFTLAHTHTSVSLFAIKLGFQRQIELD